MALQNKIKTVAAVGAISVAVVALSSAVGIGLINHTGNKSSDGSETVVNINNFDTQDQNLQDADSVYTYPLAGIAQGLQKAGNTASANGKDNSIEDGTEGTDTTPVPATPTPTPEPTATPTPTPEPTATSTPTPTPDPRSTVLNHYTNLGVVDDVNNYLNVREEPSLDAAVIGKVLKFSAVNIVEDTGDGWYKIDFGYNDHEYGYVSSDFVATGDEAADLAIDNAKQTINVSTEVLNVRAEPNTDSEVVTQIVEHETYYVVDILDGWVQIDLGVNEDGEDYTPYVSADYVTLDYALPGPIAYEEEEVAEETINPVRTELVNFALQYLGGTYVWGGTTLGVGVDCSGFTQQVFAQFGYSLERVSYWQAEQGTQITADQLQPGDLVFYSRPGYAIGHVAIYIGNGQIIHAYNADRGIIITSYDYATPIRFVNIIGE